MSATPSGATRGGLLVAYAAGVEGARIGPRFGGVETGVGKAAMACALTEAVRARRPPAVLLVGVCGAFPASHRGGAGPALLDLCLVAEEVFADEGVATPDGFLPLSTFGMSPGGPFPADPTWLAWARAALPEARVVRGATVSVCSGRDDLSREVAARTAADVETMEGAAAALVCARVGVPLIQLRCVSNATGDRAAASFAIEEAAARVQDAALRLLGRPLP